MSRFINRYIGYSLAWGTTSGLLFATQAKNTSQEKDAKTMFKHYVPTLIFFNIGALAMPVLIPYGVYELGKISTINTSSESGLFDYEINIETETNTTTTTSTTTTTTTVEGKKE